MTRVISSIYEIDLLLTKFIQRKQPNPKTLKNIKFVKSSLIFTLPTHPIVPFLIRCLKDNTPFNISIFKIITNSMAPVVVIAALTILSILVIITKSFSKEMVMLILSVLPIVTGSYLKKIISRARPDEKKVKVWVEEKSYNFPSTHAAVSFSLYGFLAFICIWYQNPPILLILAIAMIVLVSFSRIYLGAHYPSDVLGGIVLGALNLIALISVYVTIPYNILNIKIVWILLIIGWVFVIKFYKKYPDNIPDFLHELPTILSRIYTGVIISIISLGAVWLGGITFKIFMLTLLIIGFWEIFNVKTTNKKKEFLKFVSGAVAIIFITTIIVLRNSQEGLFLTFVFVITAALSDVSGWGIGKFFGKHKIFPSISPEKTWEGTIAAMTIPSIILGLYWINKINISVGIVWILSVSAISGDLIESALKRKLGIKDFSNFLPGHGGILDRVDSQFFTGFVLYVLYSLNILRLL